MKLGVALPLIDVAVGGDPAAIREFAQTAEEIGYQDLAHPTTSSASTSRAAPIGATATPRPIFSTTRLSCSASSPTVPGMSNSQPRC